MKKFILIPRVEVHNANALSSPFTIGFPAMTAWLGAMHALQRKLQAEGFTSLTFPSIAVVCHKIDLQTHKGTGDYVHSIIGTANPLEKKGKDFIRPAFVEEARCHLQVSLVLEYEGINKFKLDAMLPILEKHLHTTIKLASGDILRFGKLETRKISDEKEFRALMRKLMPGYLLVERRDLMQEAMKAQVEAGNPIDALDALLDFLKVMNRCERDEEGKVQWTSQRKTVGWIVPIATGYQGISELGYAKNQRDPTTPHRFAESVVTLGEFKMPYRVKHFDELLWHYHFNKENHLYLCQQNHSLS